MISPISPAVAGSANSVQGMDAPRQVSASYGFSLNDIAQFEKAYQAGGPAPAQQAQLTGMPLSSDQSAMVKAVLQPFDELNSAAAQLNETASSYAGTTDMSPGEMLMLTARCQQFVFRCELTANAANRTSDGIQQLFRQQS